MNIAIITTVHPPLDTRIFHKQAVTLQSSGHRVTLFAPFSPGAEAACETRGICYIPLEQDTGSRRVRLYRWRQLIRLLRQGKFDVWHFHDPELLPLTILLKRLFRINVKLIYDVHEDVPKDVLDKPWIPSLLRKPISHAVDIIEKWGVKRCDLAIAATDSIGERIARATTFWTVVRNYPLIKKPRASDSDHNVRDLIQVIYCGSLTEIRGIHQIVVAMNELIELPVKLVLIGKFYPLEFEQKIRNLVGPNVEICRHVPFEQLEGYLSNSDIGIVCFQPTPNHIEAMPNKLFEYMEAGLPIIASNFPLWIDIVCGSECGVVVDPTDPHAIATAIKHLAEDAEMRWRLGTAGRTAVEKRFSWQSQAANLLEAYSLLG